jgi:putative oxidoreductase
MGDGATALYFPALGALYAALIPWVEVALRAAVGLLLVPHGMRAYLGFFKGTGPPVGNFTQMADFLDSVPRYRPGWFWALVILLVEFIGGPLLALGLFTRPVAALIFVFLFFSCVFHYGIGKWFWNKEGIEYPVLWTIGVLYYAIAGGGRYSLDRWLGWEF